MTTRTECIRDAGEKFGAILADPERREQIRRDLAAQTSAQPHVPPRDAAGRRNNTHK